MTAFESQSARQPVELEVGREHDAKIAREIRGIEMAKKDERPIDAGLAALVGKSEQELIDFWKQRFALIAAIPMDTARVGALTPQLRELVRIENREERKRLTTARMKAFTQLPHDQQERISKTRKAAYEIDRGVLEEDQKMVDEILPTLPEAKGYPTAVR
jgi:hypothetical protein